MALNRDDKVLEIKEILQNDLTATDLKLSLFISAAQCYKQDFLLNPFPIFYLNEEIKDFEKLLSDISDIPAVDELLIMVNCGYLIES